MRRDEAAVGILTKDRGIAQGEEGEEGDQGVVLDALLGAAGLHQMKLALR